MFEHNIIICVYYTVCSLLSDVTKHVVIQLVSVNAAQRAQHVSQACHADHNRPLRTW